MLGFMISTWFLSMWISNTATTAMMLPIVIAVLEELGHVMRLEEGRVSTNGVRDEEDQASDVELDAVKKGYLFCLFIY